MKLKNIIIVIIIILLIATIGLSLSKKNNSDVNKIKSLKELFPDKSNSYKYIYNDKEINVTMNIQKDDDKLIVTMIYNDNISNSKINDIYEIYDDKIIQNKKYYHDEVLVSTKPDNVLLNSFPYDGLVYKSSDDLITYSVSLTNKNKIQIKCSSNVIIYENENMITNNYIETYIFEKNKGLVLYKTEIENNKNSITEFKLKG